MRGRLPDAGTPGTAVHAGLDEGSVSDSSLCWHDRSSFCVSSSGRVWARIFRRRAFPKPFHRRPTAPATGLPSGRGHSAGADDVHDHVGGLPQLERGIERLGKGVEEGQGVQARDCRERPAWSWIGPRPSCPASPAEVPLARGRGTLGDGTMVPTQAAPPGNGRLVWV